MTSGVLAVPLGLEKKRFFMTISERTDMRGSFMILCAWEGSSPSAINNSSTSCRCRSLAKPKDVDRNKILMTMIKHRKFLCTHPPLLVFSPTKLTASYYISESTLCKRIYSHLPSLISPINPAICFFPGFPGRLNVFPYRIHFFRPRRK